MTIFEWFIIMTPLILSLCYCGYMIGLWWDTPKYKEKDSWFWNMEYEYGKKLYKEHPYFFTKKQQKIIESILEKETKPVDQQ